MAIRIALGADHGGYQLKTELSIWLREQDYDVQDIGALFLDPSDDYPDFAVAVANEVATGEAHRGIIVCGSGVGASITANKVSGVRAGLCHDIYSAHQGVEHDDMNVLCLGARVIEVTHAIDLTRAFLGAQFSGEDRHQRRLDKMLAIEKRSFRQG
jgi:ribose 5-phosphate isomerase B